MPKSLPLSSGTALSSQAHWTMASSASSVTRPRRRMNARIERPITETWPGRPNSPGRHAIGDGTAIGVPRVHYLTGNCTSGLGHHTVREWLHEHTVGISANRLLRTPPAAVANDEAQESARPRDRGWHLHA